MEVPPAHHSSETYRQHHRRLVYIYVQSIAIIQELCTKFILPGGFSLPGRRAFFQILYSSARTHSPQSPDPVMMSPLQERHPTGFLNFHLILTQQEM